MDDTLVRHIYDVHKIHQAEQNAFEPALAVFRDLVNGDREEFKGQNPTFDANPKNTLTDALNRTCSDKTLIANYEQKLRPLIYTATAPDYATAFQSFELIAKRLLATLS